MLGCFLLCARVCVCRSVTSFPSYHSLFALPSRVTHSLNMPFHTLFRFPIVSRTVLNVFICKEVDGVSYMVRSLPFWCFFFFSLFLFFSLVPGAGVRKGTRKEDSVVGVVPRSFSQFCCFAVDPLCSFLSGLSFFFFTPPFLPLALFLRG